MVLKNKEAGLPVATCPGCYDSWSGWWCDNCDQWPCICTNDEED